MVGNFSTVLNFNQLFFKLFSPIVVVDGRETLSSFEDHDIHYNQEHVIIKI